MAECTIQDLRAAGGCPENLTIKQIGWAQLQMLCSITDWLSGDSISTCDFDALIEEGRCTTASVNELEYWKALKLCELVTALSSGAAIAAISAYFSFVNYADARAQTFFAADMVVGILGAVTRSDGGEGMWYYNASSTLADNASTVLRPDNVAIADPGRLIRIS